MVNKVLVVVISFVIIIQANEISTKRIKRQSSKNDSDPCAPYTPAKPNFYKPGRRISEIKCYEYIWHLRYRQDRDIRKAACNPNDSIFKRLHTAVVGGRSTFLGEYPHMAAIGWRSTNDSWLFKCGGSLISPNFILTAGHCTSASDRDTSVADLVPKIVRLGDKSIISLGSGPTWVDIKITKILAHPQYSSPKKYNDIAVMQLEKDVEFSKNMQPACLWSNSRSNSYGTQATVSGWGATVAGGSSTPELQVASVDIIDTEQCNQLLQTACNRLWCGVQHQICAGKLAGGVDTCQGDSGGPLQVKIPIPITSQGNLHYIIGVTSFGQGCARPDSPGVYTKVSDFIDWIEKVVFK